MLDAILRNKILRHDGLSTAHRLTFHVFLFLIPRNADVHHQVDGVGHIQVKIRRPCPRTQRRTVCVVHLRAEVRPHEEARQPRDEVEAAGTVRVLGEWQRLEEIREPVGQCLGEVFGRRPVLQLQDHRVAARVAKPPPDALEAVPEAAHLVPDDHHVAAAVHQLVVQLPELGGERLRPPQAAVEVRVAVGHHDRNAAAPVFAEQGEVGAFIRVEQLQQAVSVEPPVTRLSTADNARR